MSRIEMYQGNNKNWVVTVYDEDGAVVDISTAELTFSVKATEGASDYLFQRMNTAAGGGDTEIAFVTDGSDGKATIKIIPANTTDVGAGEYWYDIEMVLSSRTLTIVKNTFTVKLPIT